MSLLSGKTIEQVNEMNPLDFQAFTKVINNGVPMSKEEFRHYVDSAKRNGGIHFSSARYKTKAEYDSTLASGINNPGWLKGKMIYKEIELNQKYDNDTEKEISSFIDIVKHNFPPMLFVSLPFIALLLKIMYAKKKNYYYVNYLIFVLHFYIFVFIALLIGCGFLKWGI